MGASGDLEPRAKLSGTENDEGGQVEMISGLHEIGIETGLDLISLTKTIKPERITSISADAAQEEIEFFVDSGATGRGFRVNADINKDKSWDGQREGGGA